MILNRLGGLSAMSILTDHHSPQPPKSLLASLYTTSGKKWLYALAPLLVGGLVLVIFVLHMAGSSLSSQHSARGGSVASPANNSAGQSTLSVSGTQLIGGDGRPVVLRGAMIDTSFDYSKDWDAGNDPAQYLNPATFTAMVSWHMNALRLNVSEWIAQQNPNAYYAKLDTVVRQATAAGLYVVIDLHADAKAGDSNHDAMLRPADLDWWKRIATRYKDNSRVLYDPVNEPGYPSWGMWLQGGTDANGQPVAGFLDIIQAIRSTGSRQIIVVEPGRVSGGTAQDGGWNGYVGQLTDPDIVYSAHLYKGIIQDQVENPTAYANLWDKTWGAVLGKHPIYYGEWDVNPHPQASQAGQCKGLTDANADQLTNNFLRYMQDRGASWTAWNFRTYQLLRDYAPSYDPTTFDIGQPWQCGDAVASHAGMGSVVKSFLAGNP